MVEIPSFPDFHYTLDDNGIPVAEPDMCKWVKWMATHRDRHIAQAEVGDMWISTVFTGWNMSYGGEPLLFETMIFGGDEDINEYQERYSTRTEALIGHKKWFDICKMLAKMKEDQEWESRAQVSTKS